MAIRDGERRRWLLSRDGGSRSSRSWGPFATGRRAAAALGTILVTAIVGWAVTYFAPGIVNPKTDSPPVATNVLDDPAAIDIFSDDGVQMLLPAGAVTPTTPNPPGRWCNGFHDWGRRLGGADVDATKLRLIVQGTTDKAVVITGLGAHILNRKLVTGLNVGCPSAGQAQIRVLALDLDSPNPSATHLIRGKRSPFGFTLRKGETEIFDITATTVKPEMVEWNLRLDLTVDGRPQSIEVQDRGAPFRTVAAPKGSSYDWTDYWVTDNGVRRSPFENLS
jgi:hypothetical protein